MGFIKCLAFLALIFPIGSLCAEESPEIGRIFYHIARKDYNRAIDEYLTYHEKTYAHRFDVLQEFATHLIESGIQSPDAETQILSLYGLGMSGLPTGVNILSRAIQSEHPYVQALTLQLLGKMYDDHVDDLLSQALHSNFLMIRFEALFQLASRKSSVTLGNIESLLNRLPKPFHVFFPELFAVHHTPESVSALKKMISDSYPPLRLATIAAVIKHQIDELLPSIRSMATHPSPSEQEACATALGYMRDLSSLDRLKQMSEASHFEAKLASLRSLCFLGYEEYEKKVIEEAKGKNLFTIPLLGELAGGNELLKELCKDPDQNVRINAAIALLMKKDDACMDVLHEIFTLGDKQLGLTPHHSMGHTLFAWKTIPLASVKSDMRENVLAVTLQFLSELLKASIDLPEEQFLKIANDLFQAQQNVFAPLLMHLLEQRATDGCIALLKRKTQELGNPLVRSYANLALYRLGIEGPYRENVMSWINHSKELDMIRFLPIADRKSKESAPITPYQLTPEESSSLLIESFETIASKHEPESIVHLLKTMRDGNEKNRYALSGLLIRATQ